MLTRCEKYENARTTSSAWAIGSSLSSVSSSRLTTGACSAPARRNAIAVWRIASMHAKPCSPVCARNTSPRMRPRRRVSSLRGRCLSVAVSMAEGAGTGLTTALATELAAALIAASSLRIRAGTQIAAFDCSEFRQCRRDRLSLHRRGALLPGKSSLELLSQPPHRGRVQAASVVSRQHIPVVEHHPIAGLALLFEHQDAHRVSTGRFGNASGRFTYAGGRF